MDIYGVIGWPIKHSLSPAMHNAAFKALGIDAEYRAFEVLPDGLEKFFKGLFENGVKGLNVTVPHKEKCMQFLDSIDPLAVSIGAVNTVAVKGKKLSGYNTDSLGFIEALEKDLGFKASDKRAFVLGSGGASKAVCFSLAENGAKEIIITDLFIDKVQLLKDNLKKFYPECNVKVIGPKELYTEKDLGNSDILINATPVGLKEEDPVLFKEGSLKKGILVYDLVYNPEKTKLVKMAQEKGIKASGGLGMLLYQGAKSFELWTGKPAPVEIMRKALSSALK